MTYTGESNEIIVQGSDDDLHTLYQALALSDSKMERKRRQLHVTASSDRPGLVRRIENFSDQLGLNLTINAEDEGYPNPITRSLKQRYRAARSHNGVHLHIPTRDEMRDALQGVDPRSQDALQNTLITGAPGVGKTTALMHAMVDAGANPHIILIVLTEEPGSWGAIRPNNIYRMDQRPVALSWVQGQIDQRKRQPAGTQHKPIVFAIDSMNTLYSYMSEELMDLAMKGNEVGVYLYGTMFEKRLSKKYDAEDEDWGMARAFPRRYRLD